MWLFKNCICTVSTSCLLNFSKITSLLIHPYKMSVELTFDKFYLRLLQLHQRVPRSPAYVFLAKVSSTVILYSRIGKSPLWEFIPLYKCVPGSPAKGKTLYSHFINLVTSWLVWISESELSRSALPCMCVTWLMHVCDMTHACVWHDCCIHARVSHGYSLFQSESWIHCFRVSHGYSLSLSESWILIETCKYSWLTRTCTEICRIRLVVWLENVQVQVQVRVCMCMDACVHEQTITVNIKMLISYIYIYICIYILHIYIFIFILYTYIYVNMYILHLVL